MDPSTEAEIDLLAHTAFEESGARGSTIGQRSRLRKILGRIKIDAAVVEAEALLRAERPAVIWAWHKDVAREITRRLQEQCWAACMVTGDDDPEDRADQLAAWRRCAGNGLAAPLVITIAVGQAGIDLSAAADEVFAELDFTPAVDGQAEMRPYDPARPTRAVYVIADHWIDRQIVEALQRKAAFGQLLQLPTGGKMVGALTAGTQGVDTGDVSEIIRVMRGES